MSKDRNIIFHIPLHLDASHASASQIRPTRLLQAFLDLGYNVDLVEGYGSQRAAQIAAIKAKIRQGARYDFLYSESSTMPTLLTEKHHLPTYPFLDFGFFAFCRRHDIPVGLFYRDIHWRFVNRNKGFKQFVAKYFYRYDLRQYTKLLDVLFLPSLEMLPHIPFTFPRRVVPLPAGCETRGVPQHTFDGTLRILYIGGIGGNYDLRLFIQAVNDTPEAELTVCCRPDDWQAVAADYQPLLSDRIHIVHLSGDDLTQLYADADLFSMFFTNDYIRFAVPYKLFDTMGYGVPVIAPSDTWTGQFISRHQAGIVCDFTSTAVSKVLRDLASNPAGLTLFRRNMASLIPQNTWHARASQIADELSHIS